jgi:hypothetical protein
MQQGRQAERRHKLTDRQMSVPPVIAATSVSQQPANVAYRTHEPPPTSATSDGQQQMGCDQQAEGH